jgi:hypothetical protein
MQGGFKAAKRFFLFTLTKFTQKFYRPRDGWQAAQIFS